MSCPCIVVFHVTIRVHDLYLLCEVNDSELFWVNSCVTGHLEGVVVSAVQPFGSAFCAFLTDNDVLLSLDGVSLGPAVDSADSLARLQTLLGERMPGDIVKINVVRKFDGRREV